MSAHDDLLAAVAAAPDDDGPRLVMADWFEEHGDPDRAEFIRLQLALAKKDEYDPDFAVLTAREDELLRDHGQEWKITGLKGQQVLRRGFVEFVWLPGGMLLKQADLVNAVPTVMALRVSGADDRLNDLARLPYLSRIRELDLSNNTLPARDRLLRFFEIAAMPSLHSLALRNNMLWPEQLAGLAASPTFSRLRSLDVSGNPLGDEGCLEIANRTAFRSLQTLIFQSNRLDISHAVHGTGASILADTDVLASLRKLDLTGHTVGDDGAIAFACSTKLKSLESLDLSDNDIGLDDGEWARPFASAENVVPHRILRLRHNSLDRDARGHLAIWNSRRAGRILDTERPTTTPP